MLFGIVIITIRMVFYVTLRCRASLDRICRIAISIAVSIPVIRGFNSLIGIAVTIVIFAIAYFRGTGIHIFVSIITVSLIYRIPILINISCITGSKICRRCRIIKCFPRMIIVHCIIWFKIIIPTNITRIRRRYDRVIPCGIHMIPVSAHKN